jgi:UDP-N-acetylglucosamine 4,6-dehydratase
MFNDKLILLAGGTGSFGKQFVRTILEHYKPKKLIIYSRDELKRFEV